jgi:hypothetical protein
MPARSALSSPVDLVLHIGSGKTGTSSIQRFLQSNRARLAELGCLYPQTPGRRRHAQLSMFVRPDQALGEIPPWNSERWSSPAKFRKAFRRRLLREIDESGMSHVLLSDEALYGSPNEALRRLRQFTDRIARDLRLVVYLRRQDDHLVSRYQQVVKVGETRRLAERAPHVASPEQRTSWADRQGANTYDYYGRLRTWQQLLEPDEFVVRRFDPASLIEGSLYQDFLAAAGIDARADDLNQVESINESLDAESVEFLRILNIFRQECELGAALPPGNRPFVVRLAAACTGPTLTMPEPLLDEFMSRWEESNRRVAREILGDESGQLFRTDRKTRNTTSEQRLDPARLDHFLDVSELPEELHAPLRRIAEREATSR